MIKELFNLIRNEKKEKKIALSKIDSILESEQLIERIILLKKIRQIIEKL